MSQFLKRDVFLLTLLLATTLAPMIAKADLLDFLRSRPDTTEEWLKARNDEFAKWQAANPNSGAQVAEILSRSNKMVEEDAAIPPAPKYVDLAARSNALTPAQKVKAAASFLGAFKLWQEGDFKSAEIGFREGLEIHPGNGMAHYYLGDILQRRDAKAEAALEMDKAITLAAPGSPESYKARSAMQALPALPDPELSAPPKIFRVTDTPVELWDCAQCPRMVLIPAGQFTMGSPDDEAGRASDEGPLHRVKLAQPFALAKTEVTVGEFAAFVKETGYQSGDSCRTFEDGKWADQRGRNWRDPGFNQNDNHPVVCVNWNDANAYAQWLTKKTGKNYRLPSEAEWEYAARAGTTAARYWGANADQACAYANVLDQTAKSQLPSLSNWTAHNCADGHTYTASVASFRPNAFGLYDVIGNAREMVGDWYHGRYYGAPIDGSVWETREKQENHRILRGGMWADFSGDSRAATRSKYFPDFRIDFAGFRLARMLP